MTTFSIVSKAVFFSSVFFCSMSHAGTQWQEATIENISTNAYNEVRISLDKASTTSCGNKQQLLIPASDGRINTLLNQAMFAYSTGDKITISGNGSCRGEYEVVQSIRLSQS